MDEFRTIEVLLNDLDFDKGETAFAANKVLLLATVAQARSAKDSAAALTSIAASLAQLVDLLKANTK